MRHLITLAASSILLTACGGDDNKPSTETKLTDYSQLEAAPVTTASLAMVDQDTLAAHIKNGIRLQLEGGTGYANLYRDIAFDGEIAVPEAGGDTTNTADPAPPATSDSFTTTNVHVAGVDEADWSKYDGKHWFIAMQPNNGYNHVNTSSIEIVATDPANASAEVVGLYQYDEKWGPLSDFYLVQQNNETTHLTSIRNEYGNVPIFMPGWGMAIDTIDLIRPAIADDIMIWPGPMNGKVRVQLLDVTNPSQPTDDWDIVIDGSLIESRKIDNTLYLITRYDPWLEGLQYEYGDTTLRTANEDTLTAADPVTLVPMYQVGDEKYPLSNGCLMQSDVKAEYGFSSLVHITAIDLANQTLLSSQCMNSNLEVISMTDKSLYVTGTVYDHANNQSATTIHKFALGTNGPEYKASGSVKGQLGWGADPVFKMHEHGEDFRIVTSDWSTGDIEHYLHVLEDTGSALTTVASLPNTNRPAPIGKPREQVRSVRFEDNTAYIVTFMQTDPLYKIDLSDRLDPKIAGELEITGFASYMHPIGDNYLFTIGNEADEDGRITGMKAELIDVSGDDPVVATKILLGNRGTYSEALNNLHAINVLEVNDDQVRVAFPLSIYNTSSNEYSSWSRSGLQLMEINGITGTNASLTDAGFITAEDTLTANPNAYGLSRGVLHNDATYLTHRSAIWAAHWNAPEAAIGPILVSPVVCTTHVANGIEVKLQSTDEAANACSATITATDKTGFSETLQPSLGSEGVCSFSGVAERAGVYTIDVQMDGHVVFSTPSQPVLTVTEDLCHVQTESVSITVTPEDSCKAQVPLEARIRVVKNQSESVCSSMAVTANQNSASHPLQLINDDPESSNCTFELPASTPLTGTITLSTTLDGYATQTENVTINENGCGPIKTTHYYYYYLDLTEPGLEPETIAN